MRQDHECIWRRSIVFLGAVIVMVLGSEAAESSFLVTFSVQDTPIDGNTEPPGINAFYSFNGAEAFSESAKQAGNDLRIGSVEYRGITWHGSTSFAVSVRPDGSLHSSTRADLSAIDSDGNPAYYVLPGCESIFSKASVVWQDVMTLNGYVREPGTEYVKVYFNVAGDVQSEVPQGAPKTTAVASSAGMHAIGYSNDSILGNGNIGVSDNVDALNGRNVVGTESGTFFTVYRLSSNGTALVTYSLETQTSVTLGTASAIYGDSGPIQASGALLADSLAAASASHGSSMGIQAITFLDGTTPESHGMSLTFESGMKSPNLRTQPVPEPSTIALIAVAIPVVLFRNALRRAPD